jgi:hypothetical protein
MDHSWVHLMTLFFQKSFPFFQKILVKRKLKGNLVILGVLMAKVDMEGFKLIAIESSEVQIESF